MVNQRVTYAISQVAFKDSTTAPTDDVLPLSASGVNPSGIWEVPRGVQSVGVSTAFNLEQIFELGKISIYENVEGTPDIEVTVSKVLDGTCPMYLMASDDAETTLIGRNEQYKTDIAMNIYPDTQTNATGNFETAVMVSGSFLSSITYSFPVDGAFTEELTFVANDKFWAATEGSLPSGYFPSGVIQADEDPTVNVGNLDGAQRRENFDTVNSLFPNALPGVVSGTLTADADCIQNITVTADLGREDIFCLGEKKPAFRFITLPIEVTTTFEVLSKQGDLVEADSTIDNLVNEEIIIKTSDGLELDLGTQNKLASVDMSGNDAGGGNLTATYTYRNFNDLTITHADFS